jgi:sporulation protein YlmC with PRC-barrel domain
MDVPINVNVICKDGKCGKCTRVILRPTTEKITHLVISDEVFPETEYLVPITQVTQTSPKKIEVKFKREKLSEMPVFNQLEFVPASFIGYTGSAYMMWPYYPPQAAFITVEKEHIPVDELEIHRGAAVEAKDGRVGSVDEFLINPENDRITHLVMREGHLWGQKDVTIPVSQIDHYKDGTVYLKLRKQAIAKLPTIPVKRK